MVQATIIRAWLILLPSPIHIAIWLSAPVSQCTMLSSILLVCADALPSVWHTLCFLSISLTSACYYSYSLEKV